VRQSASLVPAPRGGVLKVKNSAYVGDLLRKCPPSPRSRAYRKCTAIGIALRGRYVVRDSLGKPFHTIESKAECAVLDQDHGEPGELAAHEHREPLDAPRP